MSAAFHEDPAEKLKPFDLFWIIKIRQYQTPPRPQKPWINRWFTYFWNHLESRGCLIFEDGVKLGTPVPNSVFFTSLKIHLFTICRGSTHINPLLASKLEFLTCQGISRVKVTINETEAKSDTWTTRNMRTCRFSDWRTPVVCLHIQYLYIKGCQGSR